MPLFAGASGPNQASPWRGLLFTVVNEPQQSNEAPNVPKAAISPSRVGAQPLSWPVAGLSAPALWLIGLNRMRPAITASSKSVKPYQLSPVGGAQVDGGQIVPNDLPLCVIDHQQAADVGHIALNI